MTFSGRNWRLLPHHENKSFLVNLLRQRGITDQTAADIFFTSGLTEASYNPLLLPDMEVAVERLRQAKEKQEAVVIHGDYDVDGISGTAILFQSLRRDFGLEHCSYYLPSRFKDGYGLNEKVVRQFAAEGIKLLITVDCGTVSLPQIAVAQELGIDVIVLDHHLPGEELPAALALVNPKRADSKYKHASPCATGLAFKLVQALVPEAAEQYLDLAALATVVDCVSLFGENRALVKAGLAAMQHGRLRPGLKALLAKVMREGSELSAADLGFKVGPVINVAGRLGDPVLALKLLLAETELAVEELLEQLLYLNKQRQKITAEAMQEAQTLLVPDAPVVLIKSPHFMSGIVGIMAARLQETLGRPAIVAEEREEFCVGSARALPGFDITALLATQADKLVAFGGHAGAGGFTIHKDHWPAFAAGIQAEAAKMLAGADLRPTLDLDCELQAAEIDWPLLRLLERLAPFGTGNKEPVFLLRNAIVCSARLVGSGGKHLKLDLKLGGKILAGIAFSVDTWVNREELSRGEAVDLACHLAENVWQGVSSIQLKILDIGRAVAIAANAVEDKSKVLSKMH